MTNESMNSSALSAAGSEPIEEEIYSKDYLDLVLEQLGKRKLFKFGMAVLAILYGLAIFAPLIGNDRPLKLVSIDYGAYERSVEGAGRLSTIALGRLDKTRDELSERINFEREVTAVSTRLAVMKEYLPSIEHAALDEFEAALFETQRSLLEADTGTALQSLEEQAKSFAFDYKAAPHGSGAEAPGKHLIPSTRYPLAEGLGWGSVSFMVLWLLLASFPLWNRAWNQSLGGDRERIRGSRGAKRLLCFGLPAFVGVLWVVIVGGGSPAFDVSPFKRGLTDGSIVPYEAPIMAPVPLGYAETHKEEGFRAPTWTANSPSFGPR